MQNYCKILKPQRILPFLAEKFGGVKEWAPLSPNNNFNLNTMKIIRHHDGSNNKYHFFTLKT